MKSEQASVLSNLAGEFFVASELARNGFVPAITLGNTKNVDIMVSTPSQNIYRVEVKTTSQKEFILYKRIKPGLYKEPCINWRMHKKHENTPTKNQVYAFVYMPKKVMKKMRLFLVDAKEVRKRIINGHKEWMRIKGRKGKKHTENDGRGFPIFKNEEPHHENNFGILK